LTNAEQKVPAFIYKSADIKNSLIAPGCKVKGTVEHSILSTNVTIEKNAKIRDSVILPDAIIEEGVELEKTIVDEGVKVTKKKLEQLKELKLKYKNDIFVIGKYKIQAQSDIEEK
jgi:glucose-1-phosphate adenylyltransferase